MAIGLTQDQFAHKLGVHPGTVVNWKHGRAIPRMEHIEKMVVVLSRNREAVIELISPSSASAAVSESAD